MITTKTGLMTYEVVIGKMRCTARTVDMKTMLMHHFVRDVGKI